MMNKTDLITKYKHQLILRNYSKNTIDAYLSSLNNFLQYVKKKGFKDISATQIYTHVSSRTSKDAKSPIRDLNI